MAGHDANCPECNSSYAVRLLRDELDKDTKHKSLGEQAKEEVGSKDGRQSPTMVFNPYYTGRPKTPLSGSRLGQIDRQEIIRQIKSGERAGNDSRPTSPELERPCGSFTRKRVSPEPIQQNVVDSHPGSRPISRPGSSGQTTDNQSSGMQIERPRSALHRGDFRQKEDSPAALGRFSQPQRNEPTTQLSTSPVAPWHPEFPTLALRQALEQRRSITKATPRSPPARPVRSRAISNASLRTSVLYQPPTSPLIQSSRPDTPEPSTRSGSRSPDKNRRHTFSPRSFQQLNSLDNPSRAPGLQPPRSFRKENTYPYQTHQSRRSLDRLSLPQTPTVGSRRPSFSSESPLHHAPMVGSYEESILRGRMSTTPSKPLNFVAQIGVLGKGNCSSKLRCPPHASVAFPAVFYSYSSGSKSVTGDQPSPYVGLVDLEHNLPTAHTSPEKRRQRLEAMMSDEGSSGSNSLTREDHAGSEAQMIWRKKHKRKRRSGSPKAPPGGSYRIPQQGQLQIVIKNPNKTAVKLFLVPYDLSDMEPGQKTFIRQRSYSAGPIIDMPLSSRKNLGTDRPEASIPSGEDPNERPMLRYLVHLHICCPSKGRFFLYKSIRVVFANRVPDGKEKLRNEIQLPEPRYSAYKPGRESIVGTGSDANSAAESGNSSAQRRGQEAQQPLLAPATLPDSPWPGQRQALARSLPNAGVYNHDQDYHQQQPIPPIPYHFQNALSATDSRPSTSGRPPTRLSTENLMDIDADTLGSPKSPTGRGAGVYDHHFSALSPISSHSSENGQIFRSLGPRLENPFNFERDHNRENIMQRDGSGRSESLLSKRLRDLAMQGSQGKGEDNGGDQNESDCHSTVLP